MDLRSIVMKYVIFFIVVLVFLSGPTYGQQEAITTTGRKVVLNANGTWYYADSVRSGGAKHSTPIGLEIPRVKGSDEVVTHTGFSLLYNESYEQASWVAYFLTRERTNKQFDRTDKFLPDPKISTGSATDSDYAGSGYDRGHLAPAADMGWSSVAMQESFYYSNMSPQVPSFNRGIWKKLEEQVRSWAVEYDSIFIVTGPVLKPGLPGIGPNNVSIPEYYYKVILDHKGADVKGIGFILPNGASNEALTTYAVSIDSVERMTGIDFFPALPDMAERQLEKELCIPCWNWKVVRATKPEDTSKQPTSKQSISKQSDSSVQCSGTTKAGNRCQRMTQSANGRCYQHGGN